MSTLSRNITQTTHDFDSIKEAIIEKGVAVPAKTPTSQYAEKILEIESGITPSGSTDITENGEYDVTEFAQAIVNVESGGNIDDFIAGTTESVTCELEIIPDFAFSAKTHLEEVNLPNALYIGRFAFSCEPAAISGSGSGSGSASDEDESEQEDPVIFTNKNLKTVNMPNVTHIDQKAFIGAENLEITELPDSLVVIEDGAFGNCPKVSITRFPANLKYIGYDALPLQENVDIGSLPDTLEYINSGISRDQVDRYLSQFVDPETDILDISQVPFKFFNIEFGNSVLGGNPWEEPGNIFDHFNLPNDGDLIIPDGVKRIPNKFARYVHNTSIQLPDTLLTIGNNCFNFGGMGFQSPVTYLYLGNSLTSIGSGCFNQLNQLPSITFPESLQSIGNTCFGELGVSELHIPKALTHIGDNCFGEYVDTNYGHNITRITVDSENSVYDSRGDCNAIIHTESNELIRGCKASTIPYSVTSIGASAFSACKLETITIPESVTSIRFQAFCDCQLLTSITLPSSVTFVGMDCFYNCPCVQTTESGFKYIGDVLLKCSDDSSYIPNIPEGMRVIGSACFAYRYGPIPAIIIPDSIEYINDGAFLSCKASGIYIPPTSSLIKIGESVFYDTNIEEIYIPGSVEYIGSSTFLNCYSLRSIYMLDYTASDAPKPLIDTDYDGLMGGWSPSYPNVYFSDQLTVDAYSEKEAWSGAVRRDKLHVYDGELPPIPVPDQGE